MRDADEKTLWKRIQTNAFDDELIAKRESNAPKAARIGALNEAAAQIEIQLRPAKRHIQATPFFCWLKSKLHRQDYYSNLLH